MDEIKAKQQVIEKIKESSKILVAVSDNPSVDALSAAIGLTMLLDKQDKYTTAIFSGETPPAIAFLEPEKTFDDTTDSLRDFIIALNKEKADHLRYKVDGDSVKIFITPYKTVIDQNDLEFSQGDYNVDLVIALGVDNPDHLDRALENHGQILHDAAIITVTAGDLMSDLGGIDWHDAQSSSISEMISGLSEAMKSDKKKSLIDSTIATALLTGIVAETDRFSNERTTSRSMTVAAKLMSAGADQQLIATKLQDAEQNNASEINDSENSSNNSDDSFDDTSEGDAADTVNSGDSSAPSTDDETSDFLKGVAIEKPVVEDEPADPSRLNIKHEEETLAELDRRVRGKRKKSEKTIENIKDVNNIEASNDANDSSQAPAVAAPSAPNQPIAPKSSGLVSDTKLNVYTDSNDIDEPLLGGTLNATTEQAAEDSRREAERDQNKTILSHAYLGASPIGSMPNQSVSGFDAGPSVFPGTPPVAPGSVGVNEVSDPASPTSLHEAYAPSADAMEYEFVGEENGVGGERVIQPLHEPASAPSAAMQAPSYVAPAPQPVSQPAPQTAPTDFGLPVGAPTTFAPPTQPQSAPSPFMQPIQPSQPAQSPQPIQSSQLFQPAQPLSPSPSDLGLPLPPPLPDFAGATAQAAGITAIPLPNSQPPELLGDILNTDNTSEDAIVPPSLANPIDYPVQSAPVAPINQAPSLPSQGPTDPAQFQIPT